MFNAIAGGVVLIENPEEQAKLRANPDLIPTAVEEILRLETPTSGMWSARRRTRKSMAWPFPGGLPDGAFCCGES